MQLPVRRGEGEWRGERGLIADSGIMVRELIDGEAESELAHAGYGTLLPWLSSGRVYHATKRPAAGVLGPVIQNSVERPSVRPLSFHFVSDTCLQPFALSRVPARPTYTVSTTSTTTTVQIPTN
jgi:hypothetical protein